MTPPADLSTLSPSEKDALIAALLARVKALLVEVEGLRTETAALRDKLSLPPKTARNSSKPPSQEMKANGETEPKPKSKPHAGAYRPLHPNLSFGVELGPRIGIQSGPLSCRASVSRA